MIKIAMCVRNRLSVTKKAIKALYEHTDLEFQLYIYDNLTNCHTKEHFEYFWNLYEKNLITQVTFNTKASTFNAFSKVSSLNTFGHNHEQDPKKDKTQFMLFLDNDHLVAPGWDSALIEAWDEVKKRGMNNIRIITQHPGGMKHVTVMGFPIAGVNSVTGKFSGSAFWSVREDFFRTIGYLPLNPLVGLNKKHDQNYWKQLNKKNNGKDYILGLKKLMVVDTGGFAGSICNVIGYGGINKEKMEKIKYKHKEIEIDKMSFKEFYKKMRSRVPKKYTPYKPVK